MAESSDSTDADTYLTLLTTTLTTTALLVTLTLPLLQTDFLSRKLLLSSSRLRNKRRKEQLYRLDQAMQVKSVEMRAAVQNGGVGGTWRYNPREDRVGTELIVGQDEIDTLVAEITDKTKSSEGVPVIVAIETDEEDELNKREWYVYLAFPPPGLESSAVSDDATDATAGTSDDLSKLPGGTELTKSSAKLASTTKSPKKKWRRLQIPLIPFVQSLASAFENTITSHALTFIADASAGLASTVLGDVLEQLHERSAGQGTGRNDCVWLRPTTWRLLPVTDSRQSARVGVLD